MAEPFGGSGYAATAYALMQHTYVAAVSEGKSPREIVLAIQNAYPWKVRNGWKYRSWLRARREFFEKNRLPGLRAVKTIEQTASGADLLSDQDRSRPTSN